MAVVTFFSDCGLGDDLVRSGGADVPAGGRPIYEDGYRTNEL